MVGRLTTALATALDPEAAVVGCLLRMPAAAAAEVVEQLRPADFADSQHHMVLEAVRTLASSGTDPQPALVDQELRRSGASRRFRDGRATGLAVFDLHAAAPAPAMVGHYLRQLQDASLRRAAVATGTRLVQLAEDERRDVDDLLIAASQGLAELLDERPEPVVGRVGQLRKRLLTSDELDAVPAPVPLIDGVLSADTLAELWGKPGCGKTFVASDWALCIGTGKSWQGHAVTKGTVLYIVGEGLGGLGKRRRAWSYAWQQPDTSGVTWLRSAVPLTDPMWVHALAEVVAELRPVLIVIDTLSRAIPGQNENAPETMSAVVAASDAIRDAAGGACVLFVHHATKDGSTNRGHSALEGACEVRWKVAKEGDAITLSNPKSKDEAEADDLELTLRVVDLGDLDAHGRPVTSCVLESHRSCVSVDDLTDSESALLALVRDSFGTTGCTPTQLRDVASLSKSTFYRALNALVKRGALVNTGTDKRPFYTVAETLPEASDAA